MTEQTTAPLPAETGAQSPLWVPGEPADIALPPGNLAEGLIRSAAAFPERPALHYYGATHDYGWLLAEVEWLAGYLVAQGLQPGGRVMIDLQNSPQFVIAFYGILRANGVVVPVNPMNTADELRHYAADSGARLAVVGEELLDRIQPLLGAEIDQVLRVRYADMAGDDPGQPLPGALTAPAPRPVSGCTDFQAALALNLPPPPLVAGPDDLALLPYSSGTTGRPKACMHSHQGAQFVAKAQAAWYRIDRHSVMTSFMPLFHVAGMMASMATAIYAGASLILMTRWDAGAIPGLFRRHRPTWWSAAPTMVVDVLAAPGFSDECFSSLRVVTGGGASMPAAVVARLRDKWGLRFCEGYGLTETISATHLNPLQEPKPQCLGLPIYNTHAVIADPETLDPLPQGDLGEILISGPQVMRGYWNLPEATAETLVERAGRLWLRTGDLGYADADGCYFIVDRIKRMINVSGYKVWPAECEMLLYRHPAVAECAVISAPDPRRGEAVRAIITLRDEDRGTVTAEDIIGFARELMAAYKVPRQVEFRDTLPRTGTRKIDWRALQADAWGKTP
ncbi:AMP-binding protein [Frigidibacter mobilis]|uniref:Long-chain-fatty-acid--CoA ligase n=1 Tax=Frigidibacter mobilis TaxID=1335048 RepID=A0A165SRA9_9RHOB|nr:AMP-binding protein [Frigidibacter mobilis]AMY70319.1 long-chain-fatty-acid--CoA ligase [Frigidibacter mobilis]